jgi:hypothetical protein
MDLAQWPLLLTPLTLCKMEKYALHIATPCPFFDFARHSCLWLFQISSPLFFPKVYLRTDDTIDVWRNPSGEGGEAESVIARRLLATLTVSKDRIGQKA